MKATTRKQLQTENQTLGAAIAKTRSDVYLLTLRVPASEAATLKELFVIEERLAGVMARFSIPSVGPATPHPETEPRRRAP